MLRLISPLFILAGLTVPVLAFWPYAVAADPIPINPDYVFPGGTHYFNSPIVIQGQVGYTFRGTRNGRGPSRMVYRGLPCPAPIQFIGCTRCNLLDLEVVDEAGCDASVLVTNAVNPGEQGFSTSNVFRNVRVMKSDNGKASKRGFSVDSRAVGGVDANNDHHQFHNCYTRSHLDAGFYIRGSQCHDLIFVGCQSVDISGRWPIGLHAEEGVFFTWRDGAMNRNSIDFKLGAAEIRVVIDGHNSEHSQQFIVFPSTIGMPFANVSNVRFECEPAAGKPVVDVGGPGPWTFSNVFLAGHNGVCPTMRFRGVPGSLDVSGVLIRQHGGTIPTVPLVTCPTAWESRLHGVRYQHIDAAGVRTDRRLTVNQSPGVAP